MKTGKGYLREKGRKKASETTKKRKKKEKQVTRRETDGNKEQRTDLIVNISSKILTENQVSVLNKGLSFGLSTHVDWFQPNMDLQQFFRSIKLKEWFWNKPNIEKPLSCSLSLQQLNLKKTSHFIPPDNSPVIEAFILAVNHDIEKLKKECTNQSLYPNMTAGEMEALYELAHNDEIIIKNADKRQLADPEVYERLTHDPKFDIARDIKSILDGALNMQIIDQDVFDFLTVKFPITPVMASCGDFLQKSREDGILQRRLWMRKLIMGSGQDEEKKENSCRDDVIYKPLGAAILLCRSRSLCGKNYNFIRTVYFEQNINC
ncbi:unnamed protein product [Ranitomeya imitator]|uniref:Uncharacterized protein n=1 Tax=Ranitomeya imitator TaxID=111125 RepID=A0ABN9MKZ0_9NEOB|nr:unnamed protein product [Ranitomeya imitator]